MTNIVIIIGCEEQEINLRKYPMSLPSVLLTKYNLQVSDTLTHKRQVKNYQESKYVNYVSSQNPNEIGAYLPVKKDTMF